MISSGRAPEHFSRRRRGGRVLDHYGNSSAELLITIFNRQRVTLEQELGAAANVQQRDIVLRQLAELRKCFATNCRI
jgi:hypothetical protein